MHRTLYGGTPGTARARRTTTADMHLAMKVSGLIHKSGKDLKS